MNATPTPPPGTPPGSLYWTITEADGTVVQDGWATPINSGAGAGQGQPIDTNEIQEADHA